MPNISKCNYRKYIKIQNNIIVYYFNNEINIIILIIITISSINIKTIEDLDIYIEIKICRTKKWNRKPDNINKKK